jgi:catechol 2,3-dioxygenase-like lactoylglutathione lyase family enzyme
MYAFVRRTLFAQLLIVLLTLSAASGAAEPEKPAPTLLRIQMVTIGTDDLTRFRDLFETWFRYETVETGQVAPALARSWGTPATAGRDYALMHSVGSPEIVLRVIDVDVPQPHRAMTTLGWSVIEFLVEDPDAVYRHLLESPFRHIGGPANLGGGSSSIRATQFLGPAAVAIYLTADTASIEEASLPRAESFIDRPFIVVLASPDATSTTAFYRETFNLGGYGPSPVQINAVNAALRRDAAEKTPLGLATANEPGNAIEIDGYPIDAAQRPQAPGQLPPAVALVSFAVISLDGLPVEFIKPPTPLYGGRRAATFKGPAGELTELIEIGSDGRW